MCIVTCQSGSRGIKAHPCQKVLRGKLPVSSSLRRIAQDAVDVTQIGRPGIHLADKLAGHGRRKQRVGDAACVAQPQIVQGQARQIVESQLEKVGVVQGRRLPGCRQNIDRATR